MKIPRQHLISLLARVGRRDLIEQAKRDLPATIDTDRGVDQQRLFEYGLTRSQLIDRMAGAPEALTSPELGPRISAAAAVTPWYCTGRRLNLWGLLGGVRQRVDRWRTAVCAAQSCS